ISYTKSWYNIMFDQNLAFVDQNKKEIPIETVLPAGNYLTVDDLLEKIHQIYDDFIFSHKNLNISKAPRLKYNSQTNKIKIILGIQNQNWLFPKFSNFLAHFLGLCDSQNNQYP